MKADIPRSLPARIYRPDIDGLRSAAIVSVLLYHAGVQRISGGFTGVDIFFVISGFLIGGHIYSDLLVGNFSFLQFYRLRAKRILPAFFAMLAIVIPLALFLLSPLEAKEFGKSTLVATLSVSNIYFWRHTSYFNTQNAINPMLMTWSLGVEEQFYAVIPVLIVVLVRIRRSLVLPSIIAICVLSFLFAWRQLLGHPAAVFYFLPYRAWELGAGIALALVNLAKPGLLRPPLAHLASIAGTILILAPMFVLTAASPFPGATALPTVLGTGLIIAAPAGWINRRLLSLSPLVFIGKISYSWYLWHWPLIALLRVISGGSLPPIGAALAVALSLGLAIASYFFIEQPFRRSTAAPLPLLLRYALLSLAFIAVCGGIWLDNGVPQRFRNFPKTESAKEALYIDPCLVPDGADNPNLSSRCFPVSGDRPVVALWGDSHAAAIAPGLRPVVEASGYDFAQVSKPACRPEDDAPGIEHPASLEGPDCFRFNQLALQRLREDPRIRIVVITAAWGHMISRESDVESLIKNGADKQGSRGMIEAKRVYMSFFESCLRSLRASGKQVVVLDDVPTFDHDPIAQVRTGIIPLRRAIASWLGVLNTDGFELPSPARASANLIATQLLKSAVADVPGVTLVDLSHSFCNQTGRCAFRDGDRLLYLDEQHLTAEGAHRALHDFKLPVAAAGD